MSERITNAGEAAPRPVDFVLHGDFWTLTHEKSTFHLRDAKGMRYLAHLLQRPGSQISAADLTASAWPRGPRRTDTGDGANSLPTDLGRARSAVGKRIRDAIRRIAAFDPVLGRHLEVSVKTGCRCVYLPDPDQAMRWRVGPAGEEAK